MKPSIWRRKTTVKRQNSNKTWKGPKREEKCAKVSLRSRPVARRAKETQNETRWRWKMRRDWQKDGIWVKRDWRSSKKKRKCSKKMIHLWFSVCVSIWGWGAHGGPRALQDPSLHHTLNTASIFKCFEEPGCRTRPVSNYKLSVRRGRGI